ncbi:MAG: hypothetical protein HYY93_13670 [Planctomycetes bacterium]|nr:hypothetical protein [Planctomycetota bacterium]
MRIDFEEATRAHDRRLQWIAAGIFPVVLALSVLAWKSQVQIQADIFKTPLDWSIRLALAIALGVALVVFTVLMTTRVFEHPNRLTVWSGMVPCTLRKSEVRGIARRGGVLYFFVGDAPTIQTVPLEWASHPRCSLEAIHRAFPEHPIRALSAAHLHGLHIYQTLVGYIMVGAFVMCWAQMGADLRWPLVGPVVGAGAIGIVILGNQRTAHLAKLSRGSISLAAALCLAPLAALTFLPPDELVALAADMRALVTYGAGIVAGGVMAATFLHGLVAETQQVLDVTYDRMIRGVGAHDPSQPPVSSTHGHLHGHSPEPESDRPEPAASQAPTPETVPASNQGAPPPA